MLDEVELDDQRLHRRVNQNAGVGKAAHLVGEHLALVAAALVQAGDELDAGAAKRLVAALRGVELVALNPCAIHRAANAGAVHVQVVVAEPHARAGQGEPFHGQTGLSAAQHLVAGQAGFIGVADPAGEADRAALAPEHIAVDAQHGREQQAGRFVLRWLQGANAVGRDEQVVVDGRAHHHAAERDGRALRIGVAEHRHRQLAQRQAEHGANADRRLASKRKDRQPVDGDGHAALDDEGGSGGRDHRRRSLAGDAQGSGCGDSHRLAQHILAGMQAHGAAGLPQLVNRSLEGELAAGMRFGRDALGAAAVFTRSPSFGRPGVAAVAHGASGNVPDAQARVVVMNTARRRAVQQLDRCVRGARGKLPMVAGLETLGAGGSKADRHAVFQQQFGASRGHLDHAPGAGLVEVLDQDRCAARIGAEDAVFLIPAANAQLALPRESAVGEAAR